MLPQGARIGCELPSREAIARLIPHAGAMCLLDHVLEVSGAHLVCVARDHHDPAHPLRSGSGLLASGLIEYAAQAMALHGALSASADPRPGFLASARGVKLACWRLDDVPGALTIQVQKQAGASHQVMYGFSVTSEADLVLAEGRATVVLAATLSVPATSQGAA